MVLYFLDSYAILEIVRGNKNYKKYENSESVTSRLNLFEVHYKLLRESGLNSANSVVKKYAALVIDFDIDEVIAASKFRVANKKRNLSMVDCISYMMALRNNARFLTGDKEFRGMENVEFVK
jgi:PIN domain nuclease of toxin-antitoxin system